jgi:hypothetical protein
MRQVPLSHRDPAADRPGQQLDGIEMEAGRLIVIAPALHWWGVIHLSVRRCMTWMVARNVLL